jgi:hypothetical protein
LEDFLGCWLVVQNSAAIERALEVVETHCTILKKRPPFPNETHKEPECFPFDDLRLYVHLKRDDRIPERAFEKVEFEIQIRTFLQHAWSIATHELYKANTISWPHERIAYQIRAMLEHAELTIRQAEELAKAPEVAKTNKRRQNLDQCIELIKKHWQEPEWPQNMKSLAETISTLCNALRISINQLDEILQTESADGRGPKMLSLSPYGAIIQSVMNHRVAALAQPFEGRHNKFRLLIPTEIEIPDGFEPHGRNLVRIETQQATAAEAHEGEDDAPAN